VKRQRVALTRKEVSKLKRERDIKFILGWLYAERKRIDRKIAQIRLRMSAQKLTEIAERSFEEQNLSAEEKNKRIEAFSNRVFASQHPSGRENAT